MCWGPIRFFEMYGVYLFLFCLFEKHINFDKNVMKWPGHGTCMMDLIALFLRAKHLLPLEK